MIPHVSALLFLATVAAADSNVAQWNEFTNNFATDIAPIITLFGEQVTKQFLSESTGFLDNIIFGVAPLGILTAIVSVIRVYGTAPLKSFIGRAQESHGVAEAELCSSTSEDVCELWSNGGICRVFGRPKILEFFYTKGGEFYPKFRRTNWDNDEVVQSPSCGIELPKRLWGVVKGQTRGSTNWEEIDTRGSLDSKRDREGGQGPKRPTSGVKPSGSPDSECDQEGGEVDGRNSQNVMGDPEAGETWGRFAPYPNLSLNIGIRTVPKWLLRITATYGISLQLSFFVYATWATFYNKALYEEGESPQLWSFWLVVSGTALLVIGMTLCAWLIERKSCERRFTQVDSNDPSTPKTVTVWLQPGGQRVGDQLFNAFAYLGKKRKYVTSWRVDRKSRNEPDFVKHSLILLWIAITSSILGFVCQFVGLRGLHGSIALYQLASTLCMTVIRALFRSRRLPGEENLLTGLHRKVEGHELDWQALHLESPRDEACDGRKRRWYVIDHPSPLKKPDGHHAEVFHLFQTGRQIVGFRPTSDLNGESKLSDVEAQCANSATDWMRLNEIDNEAARVLHFRSRLAYLTGEPITPTGQGWDTEIREMSRQLQHALQDSADYIFSSNMQLSEGWKNANALVWSTTCQISDPSTDCEIFPIHFLMYRNNGRWIISEYQLEAALGLWWWSLKLLPKSPKGIQLFTRKVMFAEGSKKMEYKSAIRLWVTQADMINERIQLLSPISMGSSGFHWIPPRPSGESYHPTGLSIPMTTSPDFLNLKEDESGMEPENDGVLAIQTRSSPLQMIAQDIYTIFISRIADIMKPLADAVPRQSQFDTGNSVDKPQERPYLGLMNTHVESITDKVVAAGIATRQDALMSIIPPLLQRSKLPQLDSVMEDLLSYAKSLRRNRRFQVGEGLLKGLFHLGPPRFQERVVRALGELYRAAIKSPNQLEQDFGARGFKEMEKICDISKPSAEVKEILNHYKSVWQYFKKRSSTQGDQHPRTLDDDPEKLLEGLMSEPARTRGLTLSGDVDLSKASSAYLLKILRWAIERNCPELVEDLWAVQRKLIHETDGQGRTPIFWAIEVGCDADTFQALLEWPTVRPDSHDTGGKTPFLLAAERGHYKAVEFLLNQGADSLAKDNEGRTALMLASKNGKYDVVKRLLDENAEVDVQGGEY
ncbi:hypothetical protein K505DRAFT_371400, partial [Melanomma pulvis-pyrius CBS 109.77]